MGSAREKDRMSLSYRPTGGRRITGAHSQSPDSHPSPLPAPKMTYRLLSRERRIHVDEAKRRMQAYYDECLSTSTSGGEARPQATFVLIGDLKPSQGKAKANEESDVRMDDDGQTQADESQASSSSRSSLRPNFLSGHMRHTQLANEAPKRGIVLASEAQLKDAKSNFSRISSCHIYSLQPGPLKDVTLLTATQHELHTTAKYVETWMQTGRGRELGVIANSSIKDNYDPTQSLPSLVGPSAPALPPLIKDAKKAKQETAKSAEAPVKKEAASEPKVERKDTETKPASAKEAPAKKGGLDWSRAKPKVAPTAKDSVAPTKSTKAKNGRDDSPADSSILVAGSDDDEGSARVNKNARSRSRKSRRALLGDEDDDNEEGSDNAAAKVGYAIIDDDDDVEAVERNPFADQPNATKARQAGTRGTAKRADAKVKSQADVDRQRKALEDMMDLDDDPGIAAAEQSSTSMMQGTDAGDDQEGSGQAPKGPKKRVRKQRKVQKKVRRKNDRGYLVTEMVDEYESYSSDESDAPPPSKAAKPRASAAKEAKPSAQRSASSSASTTPAPSAPPSRATSSGPAKKETPQPNSAANGRKPSSGGGAAPKKGQQSLASFFTKKPKDSK
ncbi:CDC27 protein [Thecaphora frezii]